jgi:hypothetical protein
MTEKRYSFEHLDDFSDSAAATNLILTEGDLQTFKNFLAKELETFQRNISAKSFEQTKLVKDADGKPIAAIKETFVPHAASVQRLFGVAATAGAMYFGTKTELAEMTVATQGLIASVQKLFENQKNTTTTSLEL